MANPFINLAVAVVLTLSYAATAQGPNATEKFTEITVQTQDAAVVKSIGEKAKVVSIQEIVRDKYPAPEIKVTGAEEPIPASELVIISAVPQNVSPLVVNKTYRWVVFRADGSVNTRVKVDRLDGSDITFGAGGQDTFFNVVLLVIYEYKDGADTFVKISDNIITKVVIGKPLPPQPTPPPNPDNVVIPDDKFGLAKPTWAMLATTKMGDLTKEQIYASAFILGESFNNIASTIMAGVPVPSSTILDEKSLPAFKSLMAETLKQANNTALTQAGYDPKKWEAGFKAMEDLFFALYDKGELKTFEDVATALKGHASGLRGGK